MSRLQKSSKIKDRPPNLQFHSFSSYVSEHNLLANSIVEPDFIKKSPLMLCGIPDSNIDYDSRGSQMGTDEGSE